MVNITSQNLTELIRNIKEKKISSEEITKSFIERSKKSKILNCFVMEDFDSAIKKAKDIVMLTVGFTGIHGGKMNGICDIIIKVPSDDTPRIQEAHILIGHIICQLIEEEMFKE